MSIRALLIVPSALLLTATVVSAQRGDTRDMRFRGMDRNGDGVITRDEWRGSAQAFREQDWNGDGVLSGDEVNPSARPPDRADAARNDDPTVDLFGSLDVNRDHRISQDEWHWSLDTFRAHDSNHDGVLTRAELNTRPPAPSAAASETPTYRAGYDRGVTEGRQAGREDKAAGHWDLEGQRELEHADSGYAANIGPLNQYQDGYRAGFRAGYREGFGPR